MMQKIPFIGPSYSYKSINFDSQRSVNLYPVRSETGTSKSDFALFGTPGLSNFFTLPEYPIRGWRNVQGRAFVVAGNTLYEFFIDGTYEARGNLNSSSGAVSMSDNSLQVIIVDGPYGYILTLSSNAFVQITDSAFLGADTVTFLDGYFVLNRPDTQQFYISALYDGTTYNALDFASAEGSPDILKAVWTMRQEAWMFGTASIQVYYNAGTADFPLEPVQGAFVNYGLAAVGSVAKSANSIFWLGADDDGQGVVFMASGYQPNRISTHAVEESIASVKDISGAQAYTYQEDGRYFYVLNIPTLATTWVYDVGEQQWHERAYFTNGTYSRHRGQFHMSFFGMNLVADYENGNIYKMSSEYYDDAGTPIRRMRVSPHQYTGMEYVYFNAFQIDMETGIGKAAGNTENIDPQVMLRTSRDGGHTWSSERWVSAGKIGQYTKRALWRRLGRARDMVLEVSFTAACKVVLIAAYADIQQGSN